MLTYTQSYIHLSNAPFKHLHSAPRSIHRQSNTRNTNSSGTSQKQNRLSNLLSLHRDISPLNMIQCMNRCAGLVPFHIHLRRDRRTDVGAYAACVVVSRLSLHPFPLPEAEIVRGNLPGSTALQQIPSSLNLHAVCFVAPSSACLLAV